VNARLLSGGALVALVVVVGAAAVAGRPADSVETAATTVPTVSTVPTVTTNATVTTVPTGTTVPPAGEPAPDTPELPDLGLHPPLREIDGWLQGDVTSLEELRGKVVAVQFWTFGCSNCRATLPHMKELYRTYRDQGFEIVGVHAPEFSFEEDVDNIVDAAADLGVTWPIALDTAKQTFHSWQEGTRAFWPRIYLLDREGHIRYDHIGEGRYDEIDAAVAALLAEPTGS
jgi:thiol-disulfide isomerase/thioredoxin